MSVPIYQSTRPRKYCIIKAKDSEAISITKLAAASVLNKAKDSVDTSIMKLAVVYVLDEK
jgi:hypothetical protein